MSIIGHQVHYLQNKHLGFEKDNTVCFTISGDQYQSIRIELLKHPDIINVGTSEASLYEAAIVEPGIQDWDGNTTNKGIHSYALKVGFHFLDTYRMTMVKGRFFSKDIKTDLTNAVVVNETAVKRMRLDDPIHKTINLQGEQYKIVGVIRDFHFKPLHYPMEPMVLNLSEWDNWPPTIGVRIHAENIANTLAFIQKTYEKISPDYAFEYHFLEDALSNSYNKENRIATIFRFSAMVTLLISALGLFGLSMFMTEQRTKEIGTRKVLGASVLEIATMLTKDFTRWVLVANIVAWPIAWYAMNKWLQNFAYRIDLTIWPFLLAGGSALIIALLTVSWQTIRAATANPINALRYE